MPFLNGCFTAPEIAARYQVPITLIRRLVDRLKLGTRLNGGRVVFTEDLDKIEVALISMGKLTASEPTSELEPEPESSVAEVI
jgi:hypothetical protein